MPVVIDPSAVVSVALEEAAADFASKVIGTIEEEGALAPSIFWYEIRNVSVVNERRGRIRPAESDAFLATLAELPIAFDSLPPEPGVVNLARSQ